MSTLATSASATGGTEAPVGGGALSGLPARLRQGVANRVQLDALLPEVATLADGYDELLTQLGQVDLRDAATMYLFLTIRESGTRLREEVDALRALRRRQRRGGRLWAAYRAARHLHNTKRALIPARSTLARAELHTAVLQRMHRLAAHLAAQPHPRLHIPDAMAALYDAAANLCSSLATQVQERRRPPPTMMAVEIVLKKVCAPQMLSPTDVLASVRTQTLDDPAPPEQHNTAAPYTALLAGTIDHDTNILNALIVAGRPFNVANRTRSAHNV